MNQTKKDEFGNDIYWYAFGDEVDEWVESLQDTFNPVPLERFATSIKRDLDTQYDFTKSQLGFVSEQLADADVVKALFEQYQERLPKFSGKYIARSPQLIWGAGTTKASCIADAKRWWGHNGGLAEEFPETEMVLHEATDRAYKAVKERGADAERVLVEVFDSSSHEAKYFHVSEVPQTVH
ncbi:hypothetical protein GTP58_20320 [Duganella sp. CY15W]|uniref:hypothetical protein n=1 Tax=Duganella sp. CY15W TaxID=2692172 RepID=UPI0013683448|nr:hypothetical protein [Duganella sp. CY15W]MYM30682.1 hypothetical protein [Duganella sp. CY15W]